MSRMRTLSQAAMRDDDAARIIRKKYRVSRLDSKETARNSEVQRMAVVLEEKKLLPNKLIDEIDILRSVGYDIGRNTYNAALACLADCGLYVEAQVFSSNFAPLYYLDNASYTSLMIAAAHEVGVSEVRRLWEEISLSGLKPNSEMYGAYLGILSRNNLRNEFLTIFECFRESYNQMNTSHYAMRILFCTSVEDAFKLLPDMIEDNIDVTTVTAMALLKVARKTKDSDAVEKIFNYFSERKIAFRTREWCATLSAYKDCNNLEATRRIYNMMPQFYKGQTAMPENILLKVILNKLRLDITTMSSEEVTTLVNEAQSLHEKAIKCRLLTGHTFVSMFRVHSLLQDKEQAQLLLQQFKKSGLKQSSPIDEAILSAGLIPPTRLTREGLPIWISNKSAVVECSVSSKDYTNMKPNY